MAIGAAGADLLAPGPEGGEVYVQGSSLRLALRTFAENKPAVVGMAVILFFILFSFVGPLLYHSNQLSPQLADANLSPRAGFPLGTDNFGADELGAIMKGGQSSLEIGFVAAIIGAGVGTAWGAIAGLVGGVVDGFMMRIVDIGLSIPTLLIILILADKYGATVLSLAVVIGLNQWLAPARLVRAEVLSLREREFVAASRSMGATRTRLVMRHLVPNSLGVVIVNMTFQIADAILFTAAVGYLGFGLHYPQVDWGDLLSNGVDYLLDGYWWVIYPVGFCLVALVMSFNFIGDASRDAFDVRLRRR